MRLNVEIIYGHANDNEKMTCNMLHFQMPISISKYIIFKCTYVFIIPQNFVTYIDKLKSFVNI
jgi:hypothetical protein